MSRIFRNFILICALLFGARQSAAFSLLGQYEAWQTAAIGYNPLNTDIGAPKNLGEEFRWNQPIITYGFDHSFLSYFGSQGVQSIDNAMAILNALPPASQMSSNLFEFPLDTRRINFRANANSLYDLKSMALGAMMEELGLASPERYVWTVRDRKTDAVPSTNYLVVQRNFDPATFEPTRYVNGVRYTYFVFERTLPSAFTDAIETPVGIAPSGALPFNSVANAVDGLNSSSLDFGAFFTGLTRDDVGGLRYIYNPNNFNVEPSFAGTQIYATDRTNLTLLTNLDLTLLSLRSLTNSPAQLASLYPGIIISNAIPRVTNQVRVDAVITTNLITLAIQTNRSQLLIAQNQDLAILTSLSRTSSPAQLQALYPGLEFLSTNVTLTTLVSIASIQLTNTGGQLVTNFNNLQVLTNEDLYVLSALSRTSAPAALLAAYPGLDIRATNAYITTRVEVASVILTNLPSEPWGIPGFTNFVIRTNFITNLVTEYNYVFGNVLTNYVSNQSVLTRTISGVEREPWSVPLNPVYRTTTQTFLQNAPSGGFLIIPPNLAGYVFTGQTVTNFVPTINFFFAATIITNNTIRNISLTDATTFTNVQYAAYPIELGGLGSTLVTNYVTNFVALSDYTFRNVLTNYSSPTGLASRQDLTILGDPFRPNFPRTTNAITQNVISNFVNGGFLIVPTNLFGLEFTGQAITNVIPVTNIVINAINPVTLTDFQRLQIHYFTNVTYGVYPIEFLPQGIVTNVLSTNFVTNIVTFYNYQFSNILTNYSAPTTPVVRTVFTITPNPFFPILTTTNITTTFETAPVASGGFLIDTNLTGYEFTGIQFTNIFAVTNNISDITNPGSGVRRQEELVYFFTNVVYAVFPFVLQPAPAVLRPGVDKLTFLRLDRSEILGGDYLYTNRYRANIVTNRLIVPTTFQIVQTRPDILFVAEDIGTTANLVSPLSIRRTDTSGWTNNTALNNLGGQAQGGPGLIQPPITITFNKIGPGIINSFPGAVEETSLFGFLTSGPVFLWGAFDGSTNAPVVFPKDISLEQLEFRVLSTP